MTGAGGRPPRPRPVRGPGGGWISEESAARSRDPQGSPPAPGSPGPPGPAGSGGSPGSARPPGGSSQRGWGDALDKPLGLGSSDESAELVDDGIAVGLAPPESRGHDVLEGHILGD